MIAMIFISPAYDSISQYGIGDDRNSVAPQGQSLK